VTPDFNASRSRICATSPFEYFRDVLAKAAKMDGPPPLGLHLLTRDNAPEKFRNYAQALEDHQIEPVILVARRS
jgi:hypothetical protein